MPKCHHCTKKNHLLFKCKFCNNYFCTHCVQYEINECDNINDMRETYTKRNEQKLYDNACKRRKIEKI